MAGNNTIRISIIGDNSSAKRAMAETESSLRRLEATSQQAAGGVSRINDTFDKFAQVGAIAAGATAVTAALNDITQSASRLQQSQGSLDAVFKGQADTMRAAAKAANDLGLSQSAYGEMASKLGSQLKNLGTAQQDLVPQTQELIRLGTDLAATYGGDVTQAVDAISALFRGEVDPIERYGVSIKQAAVDAEASASGLTQAQAKMKLLMQQTGDAQGQWAREQDTYAVKSQQAAAAFEDMKAALGGAFLPALTKVMQVFGALASVIQKIPTPVLELAIQFAAVATAVKVLGPYVGVAGQMFQNLAQSAMAVADPMSKTNIKMEQMRGALATLGIGAAVIAFQAWDAAVRDSVTSTEEMTRQLEKLGGSALQMQTDMGGGWGAVISDVDTLQESLDQLQSAAHIDNVFSALAQLGQMKDIHAANAQLDQYIATLDQLATTNAPLAAQYVAELNREMSGRGLDTSALEGVTAKLEEAGISAKEAATGVGGYKDNLLKTAQASQDLADATEAALKPIKELQGIFVGQEESMSNYQASLDDAAKSLQEYGRNLALASEGGRANREALREIATSALQAASSMKSAGQSAQFVNQARSQFIQMAQAMGMTRAEAKRYADQLQLIPKNVRTLINSNAKEETQNANGLTTAINGIPATKTIDIFVNQHVQGVATASGGGLWGAISGGGLGSLFGRSATGLDPAVTGLWDDDDPAAMAAAAARAAASIAAEGLAAPMGRAGDLSGTGSSYSGNASGWVRRMFGVPTGDLALKIPVTYDFFMKDWKVDKTDLEKAITSAQDAVEFWRDAVSNTEDAATRKEEKFADRIKRLRDRFNELGKSRKDNLSAGISDLMDPSKITSIHESAKTLRESLKLSQKQEAAQDAILKKMRQVGREAGKSTRDRAIGLARDKQALKAAENELAVRQRLSEQFDEQLRIREQYIKYVEEELAAIGQIADKVNGVSLADAFKAADAELKTLENDLAGYTDKLAQAWHPTHIDYWQKKISETQHAIASVNPGAQVAAMVADTQKFAHALESLKLKGVGQNMLDEILAMGAKEGGKVAEALVGNDALRVQFQNAINAGARISEESAARLRGTTRDAIYAAYVDGYTAYEAFLATKGAKAGQMNTNVINVSGAIDPAAVARQIQRILREEEKRNGSRR